MVVYTEYQVCMIVTTRQGIYVYPVLLYLAVYTSRTKEKKLAPHLCVHY